MTLQLFGQTPGFAQEFRGHRGQDSPPRCSAKTQTPSGGTPGRGARPVGLGQGQGLHLADLDAGAAESAAVADDQGLALQAQDPEGTGLHALAAGDTFVRVKDQAHVN